VTKPLPARPNLEHLRTQAKALLARMRESDPVGAAGFRLADAQLAVARQNGFAGWPGLARYVERLRSLEGTWEFRSLQVDGQPMPAGPTAQLLIDGDRFRMDSPEATYEGIFDIDVEVTPHAIDVDFVEGPEAGQRSRGIFTLDGDRLTLCIGFAGVDRPAGFVTTPGCGHALEELVRVKHARPSGVDGGTPQPPAPPPPQGDPSTFTGEVTPTLARLQGEWLPTQLVSSGKALAASMLAYGSRTMTGAETKVVFGGQTMVHANVRIHESSSPLEVDYFHLSGRVRGSISLGLMQWVGEEVVFCMSAPGDARPADFTCGSDSGRTLSQWKRR